MDVGRNADTLRSLIRAREQRYPILWRIGVESLYLSEPKVAFLVVEPIEWSIR